MPFIVEATVALNAKDALPEWTPFDLNLRQRDFNEFNRGAMVRLLNSISEKTKKYNKSYRNLPYVARKPFVLALTPFDQPFFYLQVQRRNRGGPLWLLRRRTGAFRRPVERRLYPRNELEDRPEKRHRRVAPGHIQR